MRVGDPSLSTDAASALPSRFAAFVAIFILASLILQLGLHVAALVRAGESVTLALWRFFGYFTILVNICLVLVAGAMAWAPAHRLASPRARLMAATAIAGVGLTYSLALRATWSPTGWQAVADHALHDAAPLLFLALWWLADHGRLRFRDAPLAMLGPALYAGYALARGAADGWYAYWFLDPSRLAPAHMAVSVGVLLIVFSLLASGLIVVDRWLGDLALRAKPD